MKEIKISVIIPCRNEEKYIENCLNSILNQDFLGEVEIIVVDGESIDKTPDILRGYKDLTIINNPQRIVPISMNLGIKQAKGDYIVRIDAHCEYPNNYLSELIKNSIKYKADNIGCVMETLPADDSDISKAIAIAISHPLGVGNSYFRVGTSQIRDVDTVPFGCYKKEVFEKIGLYDEELVRNQDDELNARLIQSGGRIILLPHIILKYYARDSVNKVYKMFYQYGLYKPLVNKKLKKPASIRQFIPLLFVLTILLGGVIGLFYKAVLYLTIITVLIYLIILFFVSFKIVQNKKLNKKALLYLPLTFTAIHWGYGWGYIKGIVRVLMSKKNNVESNR